MQSDFDNTFNYAKAIAGLTQANQSDQTSLGQIQAELADYAAAGASWSALTKTRVDQLNAEQARLGALITQRGETIAEMQNIAALSPANKAALFTMFSASGDTVVSFMTRMPFNVQTALADPDVTNLIADATLSAQVKGRLAKLAYAKYKVNTTHAQSLAEANRYLILPSK
jgi:hypothetical protein